MGVNVEILRNLRAAEKAGDKGAIVIWQNQLNSLMALEKTGLIKQLPPVEGSQTTERLIETRPFTAKEKRALRKDGAVFASPFGQTLSSQIDSQKQLGQPAFYYIVYSKAGFLNRPSGLVEVAFYPDPKRFFIPGTEGRNLKTQEAIVVKDAEETRARTKLSTVDEIIPEEAATLTGITFEYLKQTGDWLFGPDYDHLYGRTKNPTTEFGSNVAVVGGAIPDRGLNVGDSYLGSDFGFIRAVRLVVPISGTK